MPSPQTIIAGPVGTAPAGAFTLSPVIDGGTKKVVDRFDPGRYLLKIVTSLGGANTAPPAVLTPPAPAPISANTWLYIG